MASEHWGGTTDRQYIVTRLAFSLNGQSLVISELGGGLKIWDLKAGRFRAIPSDKEAEAGQHSEASSWNLEFVTDFALSPDGRQIALLFSYPRNASSDIILLELETLTQLKAISLDSSASQLAFSPNGKLLAAVTGERIKIWKLPTLALQKDYPWEGKEKDLFNCQFSPQGLLLIDGWEEDTVLDTITGKLLYHLPSQEWGTGYIGFSPDGQLLAVSQSNRVELREAKTGKAVWSFPNENARKADKEIPNSVIAFSPDGRLLATADNSDGRVKIWQLPKALWLKKT